MPRSLGRIIASGLRSYHALVSQVAETGGHLAAGDLPLMQRRGLHATALCSAAPKRKVTPSRKGMRSANKGVSFVPVVSQCSVCKRVFEPHAMPRSCGEPDCRALPRKQQQNELAAEDRGGS